MRRGDKAESLFGKGSQEDCLGSGIPGQGTFDGPPAKELLGGFRESGKHFLINPEKRGVWCLTEEAPHT